jgi:quinol-cytochrome oxidoreductase complex cytochrome b subunit
VPFGWLLRDVHVWSANLIVVAIMAHMARVFFLSSYKPPRETSWVVGLLLLFLVLAFGGTGYLLPWDQWAYWTATEVLDAVERTPIVGGAVASFLMGDIFVSGATLSRFFALHVIVLPWAALALLVLHFAVARKHGPAAPAGWQEGPGGGVPFFPNHLLRSLIVTALVLGLTVSLAALFPRIVGDPATPFEVPEELVSTWIVVDVSLGLLRYLGIWGFIGFTALGAALMVLPLLDRGAETSLKKRPIALALGLVFFLGFVVFWGLGRYVGSLPPGARVEASVLEERAIPTPTSAERSEERDSDTHQADEVPEE